MKFKVEKHAAVLDERVVKYTERRIRELRGGPALVGPFDPAILEYTRRRTAEMRGEDLIIQKDESFHPYIRRRLDEIKRHT